MKCSSFTKNLAPPLFHLLCLKNYLPIMLLPLIKEFFFCLE
jgi:hypothetical protein